MQIFLGRCPAMLCCTVQIHMNTDSSIISKERLPRPLQWGRTRHLIQHLDILHMPLIRIRDLDSNLLVPTHRLVLALII